VETGISPGGILQISSIKLALKQQYITFVCVILHLTSNAESAEFPVQNLSCVVAESSDSYCHIHFRDLLNISVGLLLG